MTEEAGGGAVVGGAVVCGLPAASAPVIMPKRRSSCCRSCSALRSSLSSRRSSACSSRSSRASSRESRRSSAERCQVRKLASALSRGLWPPLLPPCSRDVRPPRRRFLCLPAARGWGTFLGCRAASCEPGRAPSWWAAAVAEPVRLRSLKPEGIKVTSVLGHVSLYLNPYERTTAGTS